MKKNKARSRKRLRDKKEMEMMIDVIRGNIRKGERCVSFFLTDGEVESVFIKIDVERERIENEKKENLREKLNYIG